MRVRSTLPVLAAIAALSCTVSTAQAVTVEEIGDGGLRSPRHLDFAPSGNLYVAEAGRGGAGPCFVGGEGPACMGATGAVSKIDRRGNQTRIVDGSRRTQRHRWGRRARGRRGRQRHRPARHHRALRPRGLRHQRRADRSARCRRQPALARGPRGPEPDGEPVRPAAVGLRTAALSPRRRHLRLRAPAQSGRRRDRHERHRRPLRPRAIRDLRRRRQLRAQRVRLAPLDAGRVPGHAGRAEPVRAGGARSTCRPSRPGSSRARTARTT